MSVRLALLFCVAAGASAALSSQVAAASVLQLPTIRLFVDDFPINTPITGAPNPRLFGSFDFFWDAGTLGGGTGTGGGGTGTGTGGGGPGAGTGSGSGGNTGTGTGTGGGSGTGTGTGTGSGTGSGSAGGGGTSKWDPFIAWNLFFVDDGAPSELIVFFTIPALGGPFTTATNEFSGETLAAGIVAKDVVVQALFGPDFFGLSRDPDLELSAPECELLCGSAGTIRKSGSFDQAMMGVRLAFTGAGDGARHEFSGVVELHNGTSLAAGLTSPIPEPETYALMLAGLGMLGWVARRRRDIAPR